MNKLLKKLLDLLFPGIDGVDDEPLPDDLPAPDSDEPDLDDLPDDDLPDDPPVRTSSRRSDADERLARLEAEVERRGRMATEAQSRQPAPVDQDFQREEERLRAADLTDLERWQIQSNRQIRESRTFAANALAQAQEMTDRARFEAKMASDPRRAKYADRVEEEIGKARGRGQQASREDVYYWMLGKDIADGKLKSKPKASSAPAVPRGKTAGVRSDVPARGNRTGSDKLRARLEGQSI